VNDINERPPNVGKSMVPSPAPRSRATGANQECPRSVPFAFLLPDNVGPITGRAGTEPHSTDTNYTGRPGPVHWRVIQLRRWPP
jgi:hypothetical protein